MLRVPVFHVNGEDPEAVIQVTRLAIEFRQRFKQDVVIDMYCYRKYGHNEGDEPRFTQPQMYALIDKKPTVREVYVSRLVAAGHISHEEADAIAQERRATLERALEEARKGDFHTMPEAMGGVWAPYLGGPDSEAPEVSTAVPEGTAARHAREADGDSRPGFIRTPRRSSCSSSGASGPPRGSPSTGGRRSTWRSPRSCSTGTASASAGRMRGAAPSPTATPFSSTRRRAPRTYPSPT